MAPEPVNPYTPSEALAHGETKDRRHLLARALAIVGALLADPFMGAGFYVLGRKRPFIAWTSLGIVSNVGPIVAARAAWPRLFISMMVAMFASYLAILHVAFARRGPSPPRLRRSLVIVLLFVAASFGLRALKQKGYDKLARLEIENGAMMPGLLRGDCVMIDQRAEVKRGDVIVFRSPRDPDKFHIRRVVARAGETIEVRAGVPSIGGKPLAQVPVDSDCPPIHKAGPCRLVRETDDGRSYDLMFFTDQPAKDFAPATVPDRRVFVLGDNRDHAADSRRVGGIGVEHVEGKATFIYWSSDPEDGIRWSRIGRTIH